MRGDPTRVKVPVGSSLREVRRVRIESFVVPEITVKVLLLLQPNGSSVDELDILPIGVVNDVEKGVV